MDNNTHNFAEGVTTVGNYGSTSSQNQSSQNNKKPVGLIVTMTICVVLAAVGISFGIYGVMDSNQKNQQISDLETKLDNKNLVIADLETKVSSLETKSEENVSEPENTNPETATTSNDGTVALLLGDILNENEERTVFKIGDCTIDPPSTKCYVEVNGKQALISSVSTDTLLRLTIPKE